jgi:hypothetical protein
VNNNKNEELTEDDYRPSAARLIESLRDTGYSKEAAFADIIDNSIAANATKIRIELTQLFGEVRVIIIDNGDGMNEDQLRIAMRYGSPKRENPKSLGKFGMGLKTASTAFCRRLTVVTTDTSKISLRAWDLDTIEKTDRWKLESPSEKSYIDDIEEFEDFIGSRGRGTMIIWESIDRLISLSGNQKTNTQLINLAKDLNDELSAIFASFINEGIDISIKVLDQPEVALSAWDPLCKNIEFSGDGIQARQLPVKQVSIDGESCNFTLTGSIIPAQNDLTADEEQKVRYTLDNQGFYIYREGRLIWHDGWPHRMYKKESKITRLRVELHFTHELDEIFSVDFRKSRVIIPLDVRKTLREIVAPWRNHLKTEKVKGRKNIGDIDHTAATNAINKHKNDTKNASITVSDDGVTIQNKHERTPKKIENVHVYDDLNVRVQEEDALNGNLLWEAALDAEGYTSVRLGRSHPYFSRLYATLKSEPEAQKALDMLLWSLANAEFGEYSESNKTVLRNFRQSVSTTLDHLSLELPETED